MLPLDQIPTPCYVCDEAKLEKNAKRLALVEKQTGCKILLSLKAFSTFHTFDLLRKYLTGANASSLNEARLASEEFAKQVHVYSPAYKDDEFDEILSYADHITFNSFAQWEHFKPRIKKNVCCGIRLNPEHSEVKTLIYNPCGPYSRLGVRCSEFQKDKLDGISGYLIHSLCESNVDALIRTMDVVEKKFGLYLREAKWLNLGGGHHITRADYDVELLCQTLMDLRNRYDVEIFLEPGEAVALNAGYLVSTVLDIVKNDMNIAILDTSASAHMPDVIEMPYRPQIVGAGRVNELPYVYRLGGLTCLAGDVIGDYSFKEPLQVGQKLVFLDMAHYTIVKNTMFNGVCLPSIGVVLKDRTFKLIRKFNYEDYRNRLS